MTSALGSVTGAASGLLGTTSSLATGLGALPGGASVVASVVNNATGAINSIPGVGAVTGLIGAASSITGGIAGLASNPLSSSGALSAAKGALGSLTKGLDDLKSGKLSLASLASAGLPAGAAAQLNSAISSMSSGGAVPIKLPTVAVNTNDRSELTAQVTSLLGNAKIPSPNFAGASEDAYKAGLSKLEQKKQKQKEIQTKIDAKFVEITEAKKAFDEANAAYDEASNNLPAGDPGIDAARATGKAALLKLYALRSENYDLIKELSNA